MMQQSKKAKQDLPSELFTYTDLQYQKKVSIRPVSYNADLERIFNWMHQKHLIPFWRLNVSFEKFKEYLKKSLATDHKDLFITSLNDEPICYSIIYQVPYDNIRHYYPYQESDIGTHIAIGKRNYLNADFIFPIVRGLTYFVFQAYKTERVIVEPEVKNRIIIPTLEQCGFKLYDKVKLPHKRAALMILEKQNFFKG